MGCRPTDGPLCSFLLLPCDRDLDIEFGRSEFLLRALIKNHSGASEDGGARGKGHCKLPPPDPADLRLSRVMGLRLPAVRAATFLRF